MQISSIINCWSVPNEITDIVKRNPQIDTLNFYVDLKNASTGLFVPDIVTEIVEYTRRSRGTNSSSMFQANLLTASNWIYWCKRRGLKCNIFFCTDKGRSQYHLGINESYKATRKITNTTLASLDDELRAVQDKNYDISEKVFKKLSNIYFFKLDFLESDFLPYWIITRKYKNMDNVLHVLGSNDKDHFQVLRIKNTYLYYKRSGEVYFFNKNNFFNRYVGFDKMSNSDKIKYSNIVKNVNPEYIVHIMALVGDVSDNVKGVSGFGEKTAVKFFSNAEMVEKLIGPVNESIDRICDGGTFLLNENIRLSTLDNMWKKVIHENDVATSAFKQISYECLCRWLESKNTTWKSDVLRYMDGVFDKSNALEGEDAYKSFNKYILNLDDFQLEEGVAYPLFF